MHNPLPHRQRHQYNITSLDTHFALFTASRTCRMSTYDLSTTVDMVVARHVVRIDRSEAARILWNARLNHETIRRTVDQYDSSAFCNVYCTSTRSS